MIKLSGHGAKNFRVLFGGKGCRRSAGRFVRVATRRFRRGLTTKRGAVICLKGTIYPCYQGFIPGLSGIHGRGGLAVRCLSDLGAPASPTVRDLHSEVNIHAIPTLIAVSNPNRFAGLGTSDDLSRRRVATVLSGGD